MKNKDIKILLVDDEADILEIIGYNLSNEGYQVFTAKNGFEAIERSKMIEPDLILMDLMMPIMDGIDACKLIREIPKLATTVIVFLTARSEEYSQIACFEAGADDFIAKPIKPKLLLSKIKSLVRRFDKSALNSDETLIIGKLKINREQYKVFNGIEEIILPRKEFELFYLLASKPGKVFKRDDILDKIWGSDVVVGGRTIDVHIRKLREKIGENYIQTIKGVGYKIDFKE